MRRATMGLAGGVALVLAGSSSTTEAASFTARALAPEVGVEVLSRESALEKTRHELFGSPYAGVVIARTDIYDRFPYVETRAFQVVSDPGWNRLLFGASGKGLGAFDGTGTFVGPLSEPHGLTLGAAGHLYVCDSGNHRILELEAVTEFDRLELRPVRVIEGLSRPLDAAYSDAGTPGDTSDDRLYVADTGRNRVAVFTLGGDVPVEVASLGILGSGIGAFAGPTAIAVARRDQQDLPGILVADAHNRRLVRLEDRGDRLEWAGERAHPYEVVTSLDSDAWGNVYLAGPGTDAVLKLSPELEPVDALVAGVDRPRDFHVLFTEIHDHRQEHETVHRTGSGSGILVEEWGSTSGIRLWDLGVAVHDLSVQDQAMPTARFTLTDRARVWMELVPRRGGAPVASSTPEILDAGVVERALPAGTFNRAVPAGAYTLRIVAESLYPTGGRALGETPLELRTGIGDSRPNAFALLGNSPNPLRASTMIRFQAPAEFSGTVDLRVFDLLGREVRALGGSVTGGEVGEITWDGHDALGRPVGAGVYLYRLRVADHEFADKMIVLR